MVGSRLFWISILIVLTSAEKQEGRKSQFVVKDLNLRKRFWVNNRHHRIVGGSPVQFGK